jgi:hypothetical protein
VKKDAIEKLFWSIALPGFGQLLNGKYIKGILLITLELLVNIQSNFNEVILLSFHGDIEAAIVKVEYQWLMFYPCLYFFAAWDAYKDARGTQSNYSFFPYVFAAYTVTVGLIYSSSIKIFGWILGPVFFPILCVIPGVLIGLIVQKILKLLTK